jgi:short-subunit dehydrogenase
VKTEIKSAIVQLIKADITKKRQVDELVSNIIDKYGHIHVLVNVVGG